MKKVLSLGALLVLSIATVPALSSCGGADLTFFNWGEYISMDVLRAFEKEYDVKVSLRTYDSNELMLNKLEENSFDVIVPSDYAVEELAEKDMILELDYGQLDFDPAKDMVPGLYEALNNLAEDKGTEKGFDLLKYAVPYTWGELGILYRTDKLTKEEVEREGWNTILRSKNDKGEDISTVVYDAARDIYSMALIANGKDIVNVSDDDIAMASNWLSELSGHTAFKTEEILDDMPALKYDVCFTYSGDAIYSIDNVVNPKTGQKDPSLLDFYIPEAAEEASTRTNIYCDAMVISKDCKNIELAHKFIDFMCKYESAYENTLEIGYTTPINSVYEDVTSQISEYEEGEGSFYGVRDAYRVSPTIKDIFYRYDEDLKNSLEDEWARVKSGLR